MIRTTGLLAFQNPFRFSTKYWDDHVGSVVYPSRIYNPVLGRWLGRDTKEESGGLNLVAFVENNPINSFDPLGMTSGSAADNEAAMTIGEDVEGGGAAQAQASLNRVRSWAKEFNDFQELASDIMDVVEGGDDLLIALLQVSNQNAAKGAKGESAAAKLGRAAHELYNPGAEYDLNKAIPGSGGKHRPDAIDFVKGIVRELKPFTKSGMRAGRAQIRKRLEYLNENFKRNGGWQGFVDYY